MTVAVNIDGAGDLVITVTDTGIGIVEEDLERAFEPFTQLDSTLARRFEGAGLGLYMSRALVAAAALSLRRCPPAVWCKQCHPEGPRNRCSGLSNVLSECQSNQIPVAYAPESSDATLHTVDARDSVFLQPIRPSYPSRPTVRCVHCTPPESENPSAAR